jgi:hypothetical protein
MNEQNISKIGTNDVIIASYPGAGSTWFVSLFVSLSIFYVEGYHERLLDTKTQKKYCC